MGGLKEEIDWTIFNSDGTIVLTGGAPYNDCFLDGCMDIEACNYNINATIDDGSCIYEGNPDCENISLINYSLKSKKLIKITDVLGREIKEM